MKESLLKQIGNILKIESEDVIEQRKIRYLNKFINSILQKKILRTSPIFHEFLCLSEDNFKKYRNKLDSKKFELDITLKNLITTKGKIKCSLENNSIEEDDNHNCICKRLYYYNKTTGFKTCLNPDLTLCEKEYCL